MGRPSPGIPSPRRRYATPSGSARRGPPDRDVSALVQHVLPAAFGFGVGSVWVVWTGMPLYTPVVLALVVWGIVQVVTRAAGWMAGVYLGLRGGTTPPLREYSHPQALSAQGRYREAVDAYEVAAAESGGDPEPYLAIARLQRDHLGDAEAAAAWFRRARRDADLSTGQHLLVSQELIELYTGTLNDPRRAIPELARIVDLLPGSPHAAAAGRELTALRARLDAEGGAVPPA